MDILVSEDLQAPAIQLLAEKYQLVRDGGKARIVFTEGEEERVLRAVQVLVDEKLARPILVGRPEVLLARIERFGLRLKLGQDVEAEVRRHFPSLVFDTVIPRNVRLGEAPSFGRPVIHHDPHCAGSDAYFELAKEVAARG